MGQNVRGPAGNQHRIGDGANLPDPANLRAGLTWQRTDEVRAQDEQLLGCYVLRTDRSELSAQRLWELYVLLSRAEDGFAALKGDLGLRPNYHQLEGRVDAHIFLTVLAYQLLRFITMVPLAGFLRFQSCHSGAGCLRSSCEKGRYSLRLNCLGLQAGVRCCACQGQNDEPRGFVGTGIDRK